MPPKEPSKKRGDITYQVGWKKGTIHVGVEDTQAADRTNDAKAGSTQAGPHFPTLVQQNASEDSTLRPVQMQEMQVDLLQRLIWRGVPYPNERIAAGIALVVPVAAFACIVWLVSRLAAGY